MIFDDSHLLPTFKEGREDCEGVTFNGKYKKILKHDHPYKDTYGYVMYHRLVVERELGRYLTPGEEVHHINENTEDNDPINLAVLSKKDHAFVHGHMKTREWDAKYGSAAEFLYLDCNMPYKKVADELGVSESGVYQYLKRKGLSGKRKHKLLDTVEEVQKVVKLRKQGLSFKKIGEQVGASWSTVDRLLKKVGDPIADTRS